MIQLKFKNQKGKFIIQEVPNESKLFWLETRSESINARWYLGIEDKKSLKLNTVEEPDILGICTISEKGDIELDFDCKELVENKKDLQLASSIFKDDLFKESFIYLIHSTFIKGKFTFENNATHPVDIEPQQRSYYDNLRELWLQAESLNILNKKFIILKQ